MKNVIERKKTITYHHQQNTNDFGLVINDLNRIINNNNNTKQIPYI